MNVIGHAQIRIVASPNNSPMLTTSVAVVRKMLEAVAGSAPTRFSAIEFHGQYTYSSLANMVRTTDVSGEAT